MATAVVSYNPAISGGATATDLGGDGLVVDGTTLDNTLIVGKAGGQTLVFGTASGEGGTISTTSNATKGSVVFGSAAGLTFNESTGVLSLGAAAIAAGKFTVTQTAGAAYTAIFKTSEPLGFGAIAIRNNLNYELTLLAGGSTLGGSAFGALQANQAQITSGSFLDPFSIGTIDNNGRLWFGTGNVARQKFANNTATASAAGAVWDAVDWVGSTLTLTGGTQVTTAAGIVQHKFRAPIITDATAVTVDRATTVYIEGPPTGAGAGPATLTKAHPLWIDSGVPRIDSATANATTATVLTAVGPAASNTTVQEWLTIDINGTTRYIPCW